MTPFEARPPAKINLTLQVTGRRPDGYHELRSIFVRIGLCDRLTMGPGTGPVDRLTLTGLPGVPVDDNLVLKALAALRTHVATDLPPLDATLDKRIPVAAGLGGGSSDAASALRMAQSAWGVRIARSEELSLAESIGSDVPFFYFDMPSATVSGRGETVDALTSIRGTLGVLLVKPPFELSTASVFVRFYELGLRSLDAVSAAAAELDDIFLDEPTTEKVLEWASHAAQANDLWRAAVSLEPSLAGIRSALEGQTARPWLMSGSGSTLFALYPSAEEAAEAGRSLVESRLPELESAVMNAVDLVGPDPIWRYP